jgi:hypothetical protein
MKSRRKIADKLVTEAGLKADIAFFEKRIQELQAAGQPQYIPGLKRTMSLVKGMVAYVREAGQPVPFLEAMLSVKEEDIEVTI